MLTRHSEAEWLGGVMEGSADDQVWQRRLQRAVQLQVPFRERDRDQP